MRARIVAVAAVAALAGCITEQPAQYATSLSQRDPKWASPECEQIRLSALGYDDKVAERAALGLASGLLLGPFGLPIAAAADAEQNSKRKLFARELHMRCSSLPLPPELKMEPQTAKAAVVDNVGR